MRTARRLLQIYETFAAKGRPLTLSEIAAELEIPVSSCFGLIKSLVENGYLYSVGARKHLYPTRRMLQHTLVIDQHEPILPRILPALERLRDRTRETVLLAQLNFSEPSIIYLAVLEGLELIRYIAAIGQIRPLDRAATGKALLSGMPEKTLAATLAKLTPRGEDKEAYFRTLRAEVAEGKARGYQIHKGQNVVDVTSIATPVTIDGREFAVGISGPVHRMELNLAGHVAALRACCLELGTIPS